MEKEEIDVTVTDTKSEEEVFELSIKRNASHGMQLSYKDKEKVAVRLYRGGTGLEISEIAKVLSINKSTVYNYSSLKRVKEQVEKERNEKIYSMFLATYKNKEIADTIGGITEESVRLKNEETQKFLNLEKSVILLSKFEDAEFQLPIYNIWNFSNLTNETKHFGNSEQRILENLLYLYTEPFDIVVDPFAGGGSTIDVCKKRLRRYWASDRKPIVEREKEIRQWDIVQNSLPLNNRCLQCDTSINCGINCNYGIY
jgi:predicted DNA-binding protein YlxM (UPF0122 family)